ncbi:tRNA (adenine(22)-N(1))-methyltransferase TrmK [Gracilibacillus oryzae]|uniref:tRNA (Adenine(22)-N(1))-methyltransferase TrmK n=1 Tax=Gracilibacillus oryzae TaxID=1672701 RepID=A0A7C8GRR8_9BACI|nr:tRNA (adenine(22)-N(1))-methyltransferase TrmK [Gracilibacillus oryzae]KAB8128608.1 tRNA (adenine(22)-N(1))-methyltransferase TrmK [Gracilibacillus oryzae]
MLSKRLKSVAKYLEKPVFFADIGSDHAYLPCYICLKDPEARAIAGEVNEGPYQRAKMTVIENSLSDRVGVRKGNGLEVLHENDSVNQVTIAGMGGKLITKILEEGQDKLEDTRRLILQPNIDAHIVRQWLITHFYQITAEEILEEDGYIYEIVVADKVNNQPVMTRKELLFGPKLVQERNEVFMKKWHSEREKRLELLTSMKKAKQVPGEKIAQWENDIQLIEEVIHTNDNS